MRRIPTWVTGLNPSRSTDQEAAYCNNCTADEFIVFTNLWEMSLIALGIPVK